MDDVVLENSLGSQIPVTTRHNQNAGNITSLLRCLNSINIQWALNLTLKSDKSKIIPMDKESEQWKWPVIIVLTKVRPVFLDYGLSPLLTQERKNTRKTNKNGIRYQNLKEELKSDIKSCQYHHCSCSTHHKNLIAQIDPNSCLAILQKPRSKNGPLDTF